MAVVLTTTARSCVFFQQGDDDHAGEDAIVITPYDKTLLLEQAADSINISRPDLPEFIKQLQRFAKEKIQ